MVRLPGLILVITMALGVLCHSVASAAETKQPLRVAVASNFLITARTLVADFERQTGTRVLLSSASSGKITTQIEAGAPYDLFLSADTARPERLVANGLAFADSYQIYAIGGLVLVSREPITEPVMFNDQRVAIANPKIAPYGLAAKNWLDAQNLSPKLTLGENINQAWHFFHVGAVPFAIVAKAQATQAKQVPPFQQELDVDDSVLAQGMVILKRTESLAAAREFHAYLLSEATQEAIQKAGYRVKVGNNSLNFSVKDLILAC